MRAYAFRFLMVPLLLLLSAIALSGCGGGGGSSSTPPPGGGGGGGGTTYSVSGSVSGSTVAGVTVTLSGAASGTSTTDASGNYAFTGLANGSYTVTPSASGTTFAPPSASITVNGANQTGVNFVASAVPVTYSIGGKLSGATTAGVTITLSGAKSATTTTDSTGSYVFSGLANGSYVVTPSRVGFTFTPANASVTIANANSTAVNFSSAAASGLSISGSISGPYVSGISVALSGAATQSALTDSAGNFSFAGLAAGTYTVTPTLSGYTFGQPASVTLATTNATVTFTATPSVPSVSVSGTVSYAGAKTGRVYVTARGPGITQGTSVALTNGSASYSIRGITANGTYTIDAYMDAIGGVGARNASDPVGTITAVVNNASVQSANVTLADPATPAVVAPTRALGVSPSNGAALILWNPVQSNQVESATAYNIYWGTDPAASTGGGKVAVTAVGNGANARLIALANGTYYFKYTALVGATESAASPVTGPVTVAAATGANTVTGTVSFPVPATGPLVLALQNVSTGALYSTTVSSPTSPQSASLAGVPAGNYNVYAFIDMNKNGLIDVGDLANTGGSGVPATVSGNTTVTVALTAENSRANVTTEHFRNGATDSYNVGIGVRYATKRPVAATVVSGPYLPLPFDLGNTSFGEGGRFDVSQFIQLRVPSTADVFKTLVTYSDGTTELLTQSVTA
ncbi:MAG: carboxypeptidase regulatory-like domain-containing protein, partial [Betaproteobacteria bacterium]|nr:carboxypeptidase regulatory-like domain-containing protein [Betaproteobacteria bacterium]